MSSGMKSFIFNRSVDWYFNSYMYNVSVMDDCLIIRNRGVFFSTLLDSSELGTLWNNLYVVSKIPENSKLIFRIFASDSDKISIGEDNNELMYVNIEDFIKSKNTIALKLSVFNSYTGI